MKLIFATLIFVFVTVSGFACDLFIARYDVAFSKDQIVWRVTESGSKLKVYYTNGKTISATVGGEEAKRLRDGLAAIRLSEDDIDFLKSREIRGKSDTSKEETILLRPFDGDRYQFSILRADRLHEFWINSPSFDFEHNAGLEQTVRLRQAIDFLTVLQHAALKIEQANRVASGD